MKTLLRLIPLLLTACSGVQTPPLHLSWEDNILEITRADLPPIRIWYLEAYCRPGARDQPWDKTLIKHRTEKISAAEDGSRIDLRCTLVDGVIVNHIIRAEADHVDFQVIAHNPTDKISEAHWGQPCIRVGEFTGTGKNVTEDKYAYLKKSFVFLDGDAPAFMPTRDWAVEARYTPGQLWIPRHVPRVDGNPRPHHPDPPANGLIGCVSADDQWLMATAWEPYHELFQGVIRCLHSDFRIGGLAPGETKTLRGKVYVLPKDFPALLNRYRKDFPEHAAHALE